MSLVIGPLVKKLNSSLGMLTNLLDQSDDTHGSVNYESVAASTNKKYETLPIHLIYASHDEQ